MVHMQTAKEMWRYLEPTVQMSPSDYMHRVQEEIAVHLYSDPMRDNSDLSPIIAFANNRAIALLGRWLDSLDSLLFNAVLHVSVSSKLATPVQS